MSDNEFGFYSGSGDNEVKSGEKKVVFTFLANPQMASTEAWLLARADINGNGPLRVQLRDMYGRPISDEAEVNSSAMERVKLTNVAWNPSGPFPEVVSVVASNESTNEDGYGANVGGVLFVYAA